jgi:hypothetical protein
MRQTATSLVLALMTLAGPPSKLQAQDPSSPALPESARQQIHRLMEEKATWSEAQQKIDSQLLLEAKRVQGHSLFQTLPQLQPRVEVRRDGRVEVDIRAEVTAFVLSRIEDLGGRIVHSAPQHRGIRAWMPLAALESLAEDPEVHSIRHAERWISNMINTSEGDVAHQADLARSLFGVDGSGVTIGVLSDGVDSLAAVQGSGDLPMGVTVLPGQAGSGTEGTAMLEIIYDLAPGAALLFATANPTEAQFAQNILDLRAAGADIIVDDIFYLAEGVFQDDIVAQAVDQVTADGALYFSSAGNAGNLNDGTSGVWEGDFLATTPPPGLPGNIVNDFGGGTNRNIISADSPFFFTLHWSDPLGGSGNDYDLILLDGSGTNVFAFSINTQNGNDDPFEFIDSRTFNDTGNSLVIVKGSGADRFLHLNTIRGRLSSATAGQTSGHAAAVDAFGVAAVDIATAGGGAFVGGAANPVETFSSDGPRQVFFDAAGNALTPGDLSSTGGVIRDKPDIAAADGVATATPGFNPFFGTSAAAPHAAAIAALMQETGNLTPNGMRQIFAATALDIEAVGTDRDSGVGLLDARAAVGTVVNPTTGSNCFVDDLPLTGTPNNGPQTFRACDSITAGSGTFNDVTLVAFDGVNPGRVVLEAGFSSDSLAVYVNSVP